MSRTNSKTVRPTERTFEGTPAKHLTPLQQLWRAVSSCLLWEDSFYEDGTAIADRIAELTLAVKGNEAAAVARTARTQFKLRHVPLLIARTLAGGKAGQKMWVADLLYDIVQRPDELAEFVALYWKDGKKPLSAQVKKGLARAFTKFDAYSLAKYNRDADVKLRDVLFLVHAKPKDAMQAEVFKHLVDGKLPVPDTWETQLSTGKDKAETFTRLIRENKLGALALLRNLRGMLEAGVPKDVIEFALDTAPIDRVLPFRFIAAARYAPGLEPAIERAMFRCLEGAEKLRGVTALVVDTSPSMWQDKISAKSEMTRFDAAAALAVLAREVCEDVKVYTFNEQAYRVPPRRGIALRDAMEKTKGNASCGGAAVEMANEDGYDRIIVLTDGEWHAYDPITKRFTNSYGAPAAKVIPKPLTERAYLVNVAAYKNAVGTGSWNMVDGWSESIIEYIRLSESVERLGWE